MDKGDLLQNDRVVSALHREIQEGLTGLSGTPKHLTMLIEQNMWQKRLLKRMGEIVTFDSFEEFVTTLPLEGLGTDIKTLKNLCRDNKSAKDAIDRALAGRQGERTDLVSQRNKVKRTSRPVGETTDRALRVLRDRRPDLHKEVLAKTLTPKAAMQKAGFWRKRISVYIDDYESAARTLLKHFDPEELYQAMKELHGSS